MHPAETADRDSTIRPGPAQWSLAVVILVLTTGLPLAAVTWIANHSAIPGAGVAALFGGAAVFALYAANRWVVKGVLAAPATQHVVLPPVTTPAPATTAAAAAPPPAAPTVAHGGARRGDDPEFMTRLYESMAARAAAEGRGTPSPAMLRLVDAVLSGDEENLRIAIREGAPVDGPPFPDATAAMMGPALSHAVNAGHHGLVKALLDAGADPNVEAALRSDAYDQEISALHLACARGDLAMVSMLLAAGANPNGTLKRWTVDGESHAPCLAAVLVTAMEPDTRLGLARLLLDAGADPNLPGRWNRAGEWHDVPLLSLAVEDPRLTALLRERGAAASG